MGNHALSISPILVIDDNLILEDLYEEFESMKPVVLRSIATQALMLVEPQYIEQTPPQSMHVWMNLNFIAYIVKLNLWWSFLYIFTKQHSAHE